MEQNVGKNQIQIMLGDIMNKEIITEMAKQLSVPVTEIMRIMTEAQPVLGVIGLIQIVLIMGCVGVFVYIIKKEYEKSKEDGKSTWDMEIYPAITFIGILIICLFCMVIMCGSESLKQILLPEYSAIKDIEGMIGV